MLSPATFSAPPAPVTTVSGPATPQTKTDGFCQESSGIDIGNGHTKIVVGFERVSVPSYVLPLVTPLQQTPVRGWVQYVSGAREDLYSQSWLVGEDAYYQSPLALCRVTDDSTGKPRYALQLLLGGLSHLKPRAEWDLRVCVSVHHVEALAVQMRQAIEGVHVVRFSPDGPEVRVTVAVADVLQEGAAVLPRVQSQRPGVCLLFDFGNGTTVATQFGPDGRMLNRKVLEVGVEALIDGIARDMVSQLGREGDRQLVRRAIEDGSLTYGTRQVDLSPLYQRHMQAWIPSVVSPVYRASEQWLDDSASALAIGGGVCLPNFAAALAHKGITPVTDAVWANALGLADVARGAA